MIIIFLQFINEFRNLLIDIDIDNLRLLIEKPVEQATVLLGDEVKYEPSNIHKHHDKLIEKECIYLGHSDSYNLYLPKMLGEDATKHLLVNAMRPFNISPIVKVGDDDNNHMYLTSCTLNTKTLMKAIQKIFSDYKEKSYQRCQEQHYEWIQPYLYLVNYGQKARINDCRGLLKKFREVKDKYGIN